MSEPYDHVHIRLYRGDKEKLGAMFPTLGYNKAIREIVRKSLRDFEALNGLATQVPNLEPDLGEIISGN